MDEERRGRERSLQTPQPERSRAGDSSDEAAPDPVSAESAARESAAVESAALKSADEQTRLSAAESLAQRLDRPMGVLGLLFLLVVLGQLLASEGPLITILAVLGWIFWAVFVGEFLLRAYIAGFSRTFWRRNWWQVLFLLVPFLRFFRALQSLRLLRLTRLARLGGIVSAGVRGTRSAGRLLSSRIGWLAAVTGVVILVASQLLYATGVHDRYSDALYEAAVATVTGAGISSDTAFARVLHVILAIYSVAVFATLAGSVGAFFLRRESTEAASAERPPQ